MDLDRDVLFKERSELWGRLQFLADHVAAAVQIGTPSPGIVFGVSAPWGSGKSSALHIILDLIRRTLSEDVEDLRTEGANLFVADQQVLSASTFRANIHEASRQPARMSLAYEILQGFPQDYRLALLRDLGFAFDTVGAASPVKAEMFLRRSLSEFADAGPAVEQWILESFLDHQREAYAGTQADGSAPAHSHVHVQLIDDLDRCSEAYTAEVLTALSFWSAVPNLYFVVAADEDHLKRAAQAATDLKERYPGEALEKFVHFRLRIPALVTGYTDAAAFALHLLPDEDSMNPGLRHLRGLLKDVATDGPFGLMAPSLRARTPRQAKRVLNELLQDFWLLRDTEGDSVKRIIAQMVWTADYDKYVLPAIVGGRNGFGPEAVSPRADWLRICIEIAGEALKTHPQDIDGAAARLYELARARGVDLADCAPELLLYLGAAPPLEPPDNSLSGARTRASRALIAPTEIANRSADDDKAVSEEEVRDPSDLVTDAETAEALGRTDELLEACRRVIQAAETSTFDAFDAPGIGNLALKLEQVDPQIAWQLHQIAQATNPEHTNIRMNLAAFLLDIGGGGLEAIIDENLKWCEQHDPEFKKARRVVLQARLDNLLGRPLTNLDEIIGYAVEGQAYANVRLHVWGLIRNLDMPARYDELVPPWFAAEYETEQYDFCAALLGNYFEALLVSKDDAAQAKGADALRYAIRKGFTSTEAETRAFNFGRFAIYLANSEFDDAAAVMYRLAYELSPRTAAIRGAYARFLLRQEDPQNARAVQQGQELSIPAPEGDEITAAFAGVPEHFAEGGHWWEDYVLVRLSEPLPL